ncbi:MAG: TMEM43 family protein [Verrucomicrobiales bacterium]|nr:TMEM43 family protein [Verrucomicrobiales bacterium]
MADYTEVSNQSWFSRIGGALKGIVLGAILIAIAFFLLFWNEGRAVKRHKALQEGSSKVMEVTSEALDKSNEGKLIHLTGRAETDEKLSDPVFGVGATALKLERDVEIYQWQESVSSKQEKKLGGGTKTTKSYSYALEWSDAPVDSSKFKVLEGHANGKEMLYTSERWQAEKVKLGAFLLSPSLVAKINDTSPVDVGEGKMLPQDLQQSVKVVSGGFYIGADPANSKVGDLRVSFKSVKPLEVSLVSVQKGQSFVPYKTANGSEVELLQTGSHSAEQMFEKAEADNVALAWMLRGGGFLLMMIGFNMVFKVASVLADVIPFVGGIVGAGTGIIAFLLAACLSLVTIAIAWVFYRPVLGVTLLVVAAGLIVLVIKKVNAGRASADVPPPLA